MFFKLRKALKKDKILLTNEYKHLDFMVENEWIVGEIIDYKEIDDPVVPMLLPVYSGYVSITPKGKEQYYSVRNKWLIVLLPVLLTGIFTLIATML
ncbi:hypothetical protein [Staphylococcus xylosus]|nr:hypothetical protein [Staphylococcus xylosus]MEB7507146.1 hypothetical protein [Staphylococcus xylosus]